MSSADFAAAQARLAARRQQREADVRARLTAQREARAASATIANLPRPLSSIGGLGLSFWDTIKGREGTRPAFRVGQVDAELLDEELLDLLKNQVADGLKYFGTNLTTDHGPEILLILRIILFKLTIWDHNSSYGASLQGLRYTDARAPHPSHLARPPPQRWQKGFYGLITTFGRYGWTKWEDYLVDQEGGYDEPSPIVKQLSKISSLLTSTYDAAAFTSFLVFLYNGRYRTLLDRVLRLRLAPTTAHISREVSFEYLNRQLVWHAFTEFLLFLLPLVGISRWRRILGRLWRRTRLYFKRLTSGPTGEEDEEVIKSQGELHFLPERTCAICYADQNPTGGLSESEIIAAGAASGGVIGSAQTDVTNPYEAIPCGCVYCFVCIAQRIDAEEGEGWTCLRCGEIVKECKPWSGDVLEEVISSRPGTSKSVGFADNGSDKMVDVEPIPIESDIETVTEESIKRAPSVDLGESSEWARASEVVETEEEDEQSEEYDEDEEEGYDESVDLEAE